jgi:lipid-A-disaccharide synthase
VKLLISAGEASGEMYGAGLIEALHQRDPSLQTFGVGGEAMRRAGCDTVVDARELSVVGITEILPKVPKIYGLFRHLVHEAEQRKPDAAVVIDSPAFNFRVAREMHARGIPVIYYVCPQLWAWREKRVERMRRWVKKALVIFPFEEKWYHERAVEAEYVGHPLADQPGPVMTRHDYAVEHRLDADKHWIALLPGSRRKEVRMNLPAMVEAAERIEPEFEFILPVASTLDREWLAELIAGSHQRITLVSDARAAMTFARAAVVASGTATVEAALSGAPFVVVYRVSPLTWGLGRHLLRVPHVAMANLIAGREVVPELIQDRFTAGNIVSELERILPDGPERDRMISGLAEVRAALKRGSDRPALERAADAVMKAV